MSPTSVVLPEPVAPTSAIVVPASHRQGDAVQRGLAAVFVGERRRAQVDAARARGQRPGARLRDDLRLAVEDLEDPRARGGRALGEAEDHADGAHRPEQREHVRVERGELAEVQAPVDDRAAAEEQEAGEAELRQEADERVVERAQARRDHRLVEDAADAGGEALALQVLAGEGLDDAHAADVLLDVGRQLGDPLLDLLQRGPRAAPVAVRDPDDERDGAQRDERERRVDDDHRDRGEDDRQRGLGDDHEAVAEEEAHGLQVDGRARHELAGLLAVEEAELEREQVAVDLVAQVVLDAERDLARDEAAHDGEAEAHEPGDGDEAREELQPAGVLLVEGVDRGAGQRGDRDGGAHRQCGQDPGQPDAAPVGAQERQQADERGHLRPL